MVKYTGEFVVEETATGKKYLAELLYGWDRGDDLSTIGLGGTVPTIASNGNINIADTAPAFGFSYARITLPNALGQFNVVAHFKVTVMTDDNSTSASYFSLMDGTCTGGYGYYLGHILCELVRLWSNYLGVGPFNNTGYFLTPRGTEYTLDLVMTQTTLYWFYNGIVIATLPVGYGLGIPLSLTPQQSWKGRQQYLWFFCQHNAAETCHVQVRDIKIGRLKGVSW